MPSKVQTVVREEATVLGRDEGRSQAVRVREGVRVPCALCPQSGRDALLGVAHGRGQRPQHSHHDDGQQHQQHQQYDRAADKTSSPYALGQSRKSRALGPEPHDARA